MPFRKKSQKRLNEEHQNFIRGLHEIAIDDYIQNHLYKNPKYDNPKRLSRHEFQVFSQGREDGLIDEIFKRIEITDKFFVEFGVSKDGLENNSINLLLQGWSGAWIEGYAKAEKRIHARYQDRIVDNKLKFKTSFINAENIESLFQELDVPKNFDFLSIDIDGNDYWVWKALKEYSPRVICIEYNGTFGPSTKWVMKYQPDFVYPGQSSYFGASLKSLERLGNEKGYGLVGCSFLGGNAFFVRNDCLEDKFFKPFTSENHFEPPRYYLTTKRGHPREWGNFESI